MEVLTTSKSEKSFTLKLQAFDLGEIQFTSWKNPETQHSHGGESVTELQWGVQTQHNKHSRGGKTVTGLQSGVEAQHSVIHWNGDTLPQ